MRPLRTIRARHLRSSMTGVELMLWAQLRRRQLHGYKFRRQVPIGPYFADFACLSERLIIEIDGPGHDDRQPHDQARSAWFLAEGYREYRVTADEVRTNLEGVVDGIGNALIFPTSPSACSAGTSPPSGEESLTTSPSPSGEESRL